jgi:hypothetical protein
MRLAVSGYGTEPTLSGCGWTSAFEGKAVIRWIGCWSQSDPKAKLK